MMPSYMARKLAGSILLLLSLVWLAQCNRFAATDTESSPPDAETLSTAHDDEYMGMGSVWSASLRSDRSFHLSKSENLGEDSVLDIRGEYRSTRGGFFFLRTLQASGRDSADAQEEGFAFSVPGVMFITKPMDASKETHIMPKRSRSCPREEMKINWIRTRAGKAKSTAKRWGSATLPLSGEVKGYKWNLEGKNTNKEKTLFYTSRCAAGLYRTKKTKNSGETNYGFGMITEGGIGIIDPKVNDDNDGNQFRIIAAPVDESVNASTLNNKTFVGLMFKNLNQGKMYAIEISFDADGAGRFSFIDDVEDPKLTEQGILQVAEAGTDEKQGFIKFSTTSEDFDGEGAMWAMVVSNLRSTRRAFFYATGNLDPTSSKNVSILAVQKE